MLALIAQLYPNFVQGEKAADAWLWLFRDEQKELISEALKLSLKNSEYPPTPAHVNKFLQELKNKNLPETLKLSAKEAYSRDDIQAKKIIRIARAYADKAVPPIEGFRQFHDETELQKSVEINRREHFNAFKEKYQHLQEQILKLVQQKRLSASDAAKQIFNEINILVLE